MNEVWSDPHFPQKRSSKGKDDSHWVQYLMRVGGEGRLEMFRTSSRFSRLRLLNGEYWLGVIWRTGVSSTRWRFLDEDSILRRMASLQSWQLHVGGEEGGMNPLNNERCVTVDNSLFLKNRVASVKSPLALCKAISISWSCTRGNCWYNLFKLVLNMKREIFKHSSQFGSLQKLWGRLSLLLTVVVVLLRTSMSSERTESGGEMGGEMDAGVRVPVELLRILSSSEIKRRKFDKYMFALFFIFTALIILMIYWERRSNWSSSSQSLRKLKCIKKNQFLRLTTIKESTSLKIFKIFDVVKIDQAFWLVTTSQDISFSHWWRCWIAYEFTLLT